MEDRDLQVRFRAMADAVPVLLWTTDLDGGCTFVNRRWLQFTGRSLEDELGDGWADNVHPDDIERCVADYRVAFERREAFEMEYRLRRADGAWRWILVRGVPNEDPDGGFSGFVGTGIDLTERRDAEEALQQSRGQLASAMAAGRMGTFDFDLSTGRVTRDRNLEALYGLDPGRAASLDEWTSLVHPDDRTAVLDQVDVVTTAGGEYRLQHRVVRPDGEVRWVERRGHAYQDADGRVVGIRGVVVDVTDRKVAEDERAILFERVTRLQQVTAALATAGTPERVLETMIEEGLRALGASAGSVAVLDETGGALEVARACGYPAEVVERYRRIDLDADVPLAEAARTAAETLIADRETRAGRYPDLVVSAPEEHEAAAALPLVVDGRVIGAVGLSFDEPQPFDADQVRFLSAVVAQCAQALDRAWSYSAEAAARRTAEEARAGLALLADASSTLAASMEYEATLPEVAQAAVPLLGDCCVIDVFGDDGGRRWRRVAAVHVDPGAQDRLLSIPPEAWAAADAVDEAETLRDLHLRSAIVVSLQARERTLGMLALGRRAPGGFSDADRELAEALGARVAQAVDNALLYRAEQAAHAEAETAARRLRFLLDVTTTLAAPMGTDDRLERLARQAAESLCDLCVIDLVERDGSLRRVAAAAADAALQPAVDALRRRTPDLDSAVASATAIRTGLSELCPNVTEERLAAVTTDASHFAAVRRLEPVSYIAVPLVGLGQVLGAITLVTTSASGRRYGPADLALAEDMATRVAMGLETSSMHEEMRRVAQTLQASLLPSVPPAIPGLEVGTRYVAAEEGAVVGGDFFDVFALGPDAWAVVIGDVCGQGVEAATVTGMARHTVRSSALEHDSPAAVLSHLNDVLLGMGAGGGDEGDPRFCTVCLTRLELTATGASVTLAMGGHPLPYIVGAGGDVRRIGRPGSLLGVVRGADVADERDHIGPGDALVLYTDGVTERHLGAQFFGEDGLERALAGAAGLTADEIAGRVEESARRFVEGQPADDMAVVVVRVPPH